jgi:ribosomal-protein-alanine N-acetyltransferase
VITLRPLVVADLTAILPIERELFPDDPPWSAGTFRSELAGVPGTRWYCVAVDTSIDTTRNTNDSGTIVGYAGLMHTGGPGEPADVQTIAVVTSHRRAGIGSSMLNALIDEAKRRRAESLMLDVRADNAAAIAFYTRFGFEERARRRRYFADGTDGVVMSRDRTSPAPRPVSLG